MEVAVVQDGRARFSDWRLSDGGDLTQISALNDRECSDHPRRSPTRIALIPIAEPITSPPLPFLRVRLRLPAHKEVPARLTWTGCPGDLGAGGLLTPERPGEHWAVVLKNHCESPAGAGWQALAQGDLDGDGRDDVAFVAEGVGSCDGAAPPDCAAFWLRLILTSTKPVSTSTADETLIRLGDYPELERRLGAAFGHKSVKWSGRITRGRYDVRLAGPSGTLTWSAAVRAARIVVSKG